MRIVAIVILFARGIFGQDICENNPYRLCDFHSSEVPGNVQELNDLCPVALNYFDCLANYEKTCQDSKIFINGEYESVRSLIVDVCTEGTSLHTAVFENVNCIKDRILNRSAECHDESRRVSNAYKELQNETENQEEEQFVRLKVVCMYFFYDMGCFVTSTENICGESVKDAIVEVSNRSYFLRKQCSIDTVREIRSSVGSLKIDDSQKAALRESFRLFASQE